MFASVHKGLKKKEISMSIVVSAASGPHLGFYVTMSQEWDNKRVITVLLFTFDSL